VFGEVAEVLEIQRRQRQLVGEAAGGDPGIVLRPGTPAPLGDAEISPQMAAMSSVL
jgi:hypothetical protein